MNRRGAAAVLGLCAALLVTGCAPANPGPEPTGSAPTASAPTPSASVPVATGVQPREVSYSSTELGFSGSWFVLDGAEAFNIRVDRFIRTALEEDAPDFEASLPPEGLAPGVAEGVGTRLDSSIVQSSGSVLGVRLAVHRGDSLTAQTLFTDASDPGSAWSARELIAEGADRALSERFGDEALDAFTFAPDGRMVFGLGADAPSLPAVEATAVLTAAGRAVQQAATSAAPFAGPREGATPHVPCTLIACVALTYDDGPDPVTTPELLDLFDAEGIRATFFVEGRYAAAHPEILRRALAAGHAIENHTWDHPDLARLPAEEVAQQIRSTDEAVAAAGVPAPTMMRAPYGSDGGATKDAVGKPLIYWSVDSFDWQSLDPAVFVPRVLERIEPGGVVLMHDVHPSTIAGQRELVDTLRARGYAFVTLPQLFTGVDLTPGEVYSCLGRGRGDAGRACVLPARPGQ